MQMTKVGIVINLEVLSFETTGLSVLKETPFQCDQIVEFEVAQFFTKVDQKSRHCSCYINCDIFQQSPKLK